MLKYFIPLIFVIQFSFAERLTMDQRRRQIIEIVNEELSEVTRLSRQQNYRVPETIFRVGELNLEKARIYREVENERYLSIPAAKRAVLKKADFFKQSNKYFINANKACLDIVQRFPKYKAIGEVYYIIAYNSKELGNYKDAQKYFKLASEKATDLTVNTKSKTALADFYFNDKKFSDAIPLYEFSLKNSLDNKWWTKDAFNLAWSYYRTKNYDKAISLLNEVHKKSGGKYLDMRPQVERDIGVFYADANRIGDAISFYESKGINYTDQFIKIANAITTQGRFDLAEKLLNQVKKVEKNKEKLAEILLAQLSLFDKYNRNNEHLMTARELVNMHKKYSLNKNQFDKLSFFVNKKAAELQKAAASEIYKNVPKVKTQKANEAIAYFELASELLPDQKAEKVFFQAETAFAAKDFNRSLNLYITSFDLAKIQNDRKLLSQIVEGMLASLGQNSLSEKKRENYYVPVYSRYLNVDSQTARASSIFLKLFNAQYDAKNIPAAEETLTSFARKFPADYKVQEGMLAKIMEHYRERKDYGKIRSYVLRMNQGEFKISEKYSLAVKNLMTKIQIEGVQQSLEKGEKYTALKGYHQIYESPESTNKAKINAAYNLSALYYEMGDSTRSYQWALVAIDGMEIADVIRFSDSLLSIAAGFFLRQNFSQSVDLSFRLMNKLCRENSSNKPIAFKNAVFISLANNDIDKALEIKKTGKTCSIPDNVIAEISFEILKDLVKEKRWETYESILKELEQNTRNHPHLIIPFENLRKELVSIGNIDEANQIFEKQNKFYQTARDQKVEIPVDSLDLISFRKVQLLIDKKNKYYQVALKFPEETFNNTVKIKLQFLDQMTAELGTIQSIGSGKGIVEAYRHVIEVYEDFGKNLKDFTPEGKNTEYVESFRKAMAEVYGPILQNAKKLRFEIKKLISDNKILSISNFYVLGESKSAARFFTQKEAVLMDRGGRK